MRIVSARPAAITTTSARRHAVSAAAGATARTVTLAVSAPWPSMDSCTAITSVCGSQSAPAAMAARTSAVSSASRDNAPPLGIGTRDDRPADTTRTVASGSGVGRYAGRHSLSSSATASDERQQPQTFGRGISVRSTSSTRRPWRASRIATAVPLGPAPITMQCQWVAAAAVLASVGNTRSGRSAGAGGMFMERGPIPGAPVSPQNGSRRSAPAPARRGGSWPRGGLHGRRVRGIRRACERPELRLAHPL